MRTRAASCHGRADLVLDGGGVLGVALAGALSALHDTGYRFTGPTRLAGTSAGAVVAALAAAAMPIPRLAKLLIELDYRRLAERGPLGLPGAAVARVARAGTTGLPRGDRLHRWLGARLAECGVRTFGDLRLDDPDSALPRERAYRLVVVVSDLASGRAIRLPWDYHRYGLDPDRQPVADAVRASASMPLLFRPVQVRLPGTGRPAVWTEGRTAAGLPVGMFDRTDAAAPRWPTFAVRLGALGPPAPGARPRLDPVPCNRSIAVDTMGVRAGDFDLGGDKQRELYYRGRAAAEEFLLGWDFRDYLARCRG